jgi:hypothetical protein
MIVGTGTIQTIVGKLMRTEMIKKDLIEFLEDFPDNTIIKCLENGQLCDPIIQEHYDVLLIDKEYWDYD